MNADGTGNGDWTTLPDAERPHTATDTGASCAVGWSEELHNHLRHYTTYDPAPTAVRAAAHPTGTTGTWNAASGNSGGWNEWKIDLSAVLRASGSRSPSCTPPTGAR